MRSQPVDCVHPLHPARPRARRGAARRNLRRRAAARAVHRGVELAAAGDGAGQRQHGARRRATASRGSTPRRSRRGSPTGRGRSRRSTASRSISSRPKRRSTRRSSAPRSARSPTTSSSAPTKRRSTATRSSGPSSRRARASRRVEAYRNYLGRLRDVPRYFDEQIANMRAGLARGFTRPARVGRRARQDDRAVREGRHDQPALRAVHADAGDDLRGRSGGDARRGHDGDPRRRRAGVRASCSR